MVVRCILCLITFHFSLNLISAQQAEPVKRITQAQRTGTYYEEQSKAWQKILESNPKNADAWFQYYTAARYSNIFNKGEKKDLEQIVANAVKEIPNTFEANYLTFALKPWEPESFKYLEMAYSIDPANPQSYQAFINHYLISEEREKFKEFCSKHFQSVDHSPGWMSWNYNALVNLAPNAILITEGDNDTYPCWTLQEEKNFRKDVAVININLMINDDYKATIYRQLGIDISTAKLSDGGMEAYKISNIQHIIEKSNRPVYLGISSPLARHEKFKDDLHVVGLSLRYDKQPFDNISVLEKSYNDLFKLDYLQISMQEDPSQETLDAFSRSYLPSLFKLYEHLQKEGDVEKLRPIKNLITFIGEKSNSQEEAQRVLSKYK